MCDPEAEDPLAAPILRIREQISAEFGHDPKRYLDYLRERQKRRADPPVSHAVEADAQAEDEPAA